MDKIIEKWDEILNTVKQEYDQRQSVKKSLPLREILSISWFLPNRWL